MSSTQHTAGLLDTIRTAAADCRAQGNTMAANELLDAAAKASALLAEVAALKAQRDELARAASDFTLLADRVARLNPDAGEIGAGMLAQLVADARAAIASTTAPQQTGDTQ